MLFCKTSHKGTFIKEIFSANFLEDSQEQIIDINESSRMIKPKTQILVISENSIELFDYFYEDSIKVPFLEPRLNQDLFLHVLDAKVMSIKANHNVLVILTTCGLVVMKYSSKANQFVPVCSEVMNINCEERDKLMYISVEEK
jgi:hypothetical protein